MKVPPPKVLEHELLHGQIRTVLLLNNTDRWYLGDFLRHLSWVTCLSEVAECQLTVATHPDYLPLVAHDPRVAAGLDVTALSESELAAYDLVVLPSAFAPAGCPEPVSRGLCFWSTGWAYYRFGTLICTGANLQLNYFLAARHRGQTALPSAQPATVRVTAAERTRAACLIRSLFDNDLPTIVYNPTASNPTTRRTTIRKEVENVLTYGQHATIIDAVQRRLSRHNILIASAVLPGDRLNRDTIGWLSSRFAGCPAVGTILDLRAELATLRGFTALLASEPVIGILGSATGTNTHLAATVGLPALCVERAVDGTILTNWKRAGELPMGSFRWRNPSPLAGEVRLNWSRGIPPELSRVADAFATHLNVNHTSGAAVIANGRQARAASAELLTAFADDDPRRLVRCAARLGDLIDPTVRPFYTDFGDELAFLRTRHGIDVDELAELADLSAGTINDASTTITQLVQCSMLHKLALTLTSSAEANTPQPDTPVVEIFRKVRAAAPLAGHELQALGVASDQQLCDLLRDYAADHLRAIADNTHGQRIIRDGWQCTVTVGDEHVTKTIDSNPASEYVTDSTTCANVTTALAGAGGLLPPTGPVQTNRFSSARLTMLLDPTGQIAAPLLGGKTVDDTVLPVGWVEEILKLYSDLIERGLFNFDIGIADIGVTDDGVVMLADFGEVRPISECRHPDTAGARRSEVHHLAIGQLVRMASQLDRFANGPELVTHYLTAVDNAFRIRLKPLFHDGWRWEDHDRAEVTPHARQLHRCLEEHTTTMSRPVYPLVDSTSEQLALEFLTSRAHDARIPRAPV